MASRVVRPESKTLHISGGDWILVKKQLNHGDQTEAFARRYLAELGGVRVNLQKVGMSKVLAYLLDWSLVGLDEKPLVIRDQPTHLVESALNAIDTDSFTEIESAIEAHELAVEAERAASKNGQGGTLASAAISVLPSAADGTSSGSER